VDLEGQGAFVDFVCRVLEAWEAGDEGTSKTKITVAGF
jgi:hypothetical protein